MTEFGVLESDGSYRHLRSIPQEKLFECPHLILVAEHYREDNSCRCDDPTHTIMAEWEYTWHVETNRWEGYS